MPKRLWYSKKQTKQALSTRTKRRIINLYMQEFSMRKIARQVGCCVGAVHKFVDIWNNILAA